MPRYFHATVNTHSPNAVICVTPGTYSTAYRHAVTQGKQGIEDGLEARRHGRAANRRFSVYASNAPENAALFAVNQNPEKLVHLYEVTPDMTNPSPMAIIGYVGTYTLTLPQLNAAIDEYWSPQLEWSFLEYPANRLTVIRELDLPDAVALSSAAYAYENDRQQARHSWPEI